MLEKKIDQKNLLIRSKHYPIYIGSYKKNHMALLGIGGNIGDVVRRFEYLYNFLLKSPLVSIIETSPILRNPPFGYTKQDDFHNALIAISTNMTAMKLLRYILRVERHYGRKRSFANAPRTLDIDIIFYDNCNIKKPSLDIPHLHWKERDSVTIPLGYMKGKYLWSKRHL